MPELTQRKRSVYLALLTLVFLIGLPMIILYVSGYRFSLDQVSLERRGGLYVRLPEQGLRVYVDGELAEEASFLNRRYYGQGLKPQQYEVRVENEEGVSWMKRVEVWPNRVSSLQPVLLPETLSRKEIEPSTFVIQEGKLVRRRNNEYPETMIRFLEERAAAEEREAERERTRAQAEALAQVEQLDGEPVSSIDEALEEIDIPNSENSEEPALSARDSITSPLPVIPENALRYGSLYVWHEQDTVLAYYEDNEEWLPQYFCKLVTTASVQQTDIVCENPLTIAGYDIPVKKIERGISGAETVTVLLGDGRVEVLELDNREPQLRRTVFEGADDVLPGSDGGLYVLQGTKIFFIDSE